MTFEASRSKQVLILQPRGKPLYEDGNSSFGLKMLERMGWNKGNGLGKNQQGNLDFIQVRYKNNPSGLGFDRLKDNQWTDTEHNFNELLQILNSNSNSNDDDSNEGTKAAVRTSTKSLEETSKQSRARVHYKKFTRGKDVHKYSEKDLANIFGKKSLSETKKVEVEPIEEERKEPDYCESDMMINTGISITDYFKKKINKESLEVPNDDKPSEDVKRKKKKNKSQNEEQVERDVIEVPKKKKKKGNEEKLVEEEQQKEEKPKKKKRKISEEPQEVPIEVIEKPKKKKKLSAEVAEEPKNEVETAEVTEPERPRGANAIYSTDIIQIPTHVAHKMSKMTIDQFSSANLGNVVGYGMSEDIEIKVIQTKLGDTSLSTDKYSIYSMSKVVKTRVNPRKILRKISKTKKSIQVI